MSVEIGEKLPELQTNESPIVSRLLRLGYVAVNGISSIAELLTGVASGDVARAVDGAHGTAEIVVGNTQMKDAHQHDHVRDSKRKALFTTLFGFSITGAGVSFGELFHLWNFGIQSRALDAVGTSAAGLSCMSATVTAGILLSRAKQKYGHVFDHFPKLNKAIVPTEKDTITHIALLDSPSSTLAFLSGAVRLAGYSLAHNKGIHAQLDNAESVIGLLGGSWGAYLFRPTKNNLLHHDTHSHETLSVGAENLVDLRTKNV